jgi:hypothetical protein
MPTGTAKKKTTSLSFEEIADRKLRQTIEEYRALVVRAAAGEMLTEAELERAVELLAVLRLPELSIKQHVAAQREYAASVKRLAELEAAVPLEEAELAELNRDVERLLKTIEEKRLRARSLSYGQERIIAAMQRQNELATLYPDVLAPVDNAVARRIQKREAEAAPVTARRSPSPEPIQEGWIS